MHLNQKKITAWGLLLLVAIPIFFSVSILVKQKILHFQRDKKFEKETLQIVVVSAENIYWVKPGKEILLDGKLFDVKSYTRKGNNISLLGFFDHKEDKLVQQIVEREKHKNRSDSPFNPVKFLFFPIYIAQHQISYEATWKLISLQYHTFNEMTAFSPRYPVIHPPRS